MKSDTKQLQLKSSHDQIFGPLLSTVTAFFKPLLLKPVIELRRAPLPAEDGGGAGGAAPAAGGGGGAPGGGGGGAGAPIPGGGGAAGTPGAGGAGKKFKKSFNKWN